ncbi:MAG: hypothetical protein FJZ56_07215 [Chlamydiae bacterium]|nr:hypothetical protein [Chlamydiota bacterium]
MKNTLTKEFDSTLEQLLKNEEVLYSIQEDPDFFYEKDILQRTQASLAAHLSHLEIQHKNRLRPARKEKAKALIARYPQLS